MPPKKKYQFSNELHWLCRYPSEPRPADLDEVLSSNPKFAEELDAYGQTPFDVLCANEFVTHQMIEVCLKHNPREWVRAVRAFMFPPKSAEEDDEDDDEEKK